MEDIKSGIKSTLSEFNYNSTVPGLIDGIAVEFTEHEVRALQLMCARAYNILGEEGYRAFNNKYQVYSDKSKSELMKFRTDGKFSNKFTSGFFDVSQKLGLLII